MEWFKKHGVRPDLPSEQYNKRAEGVPEGLESIAKTPPLGDDEQI